MTAMDRIAIVAAAALAASCQTIRAYHEYDSAAPFGDYGTFAWVTEEALIRAEAVVATRDPRLGPILDRHVRQAVERNLIAKGYEKADRLEAADLVLFFSLGAREKLEIDSYPAHAGYHYGPYVGWRGWYSEIRTYTEGVLAVDFFDRNTREAVWHGWATKRVDLEADQEKRKAFINRVVDAIMEPFPPSPPRDPPR